MKKRKIFWGILLIVMAMAVVIGKLGFLPGVSVLSVSATVFLVWMLADGFRHRNFLEITFAMAFLCIIYDKPLGIEALTPWTVLVAALFLGTGLSLLFGERGKKKHHIEIEWNSDDIKKGNIGGSSSKHCSEAYIHCENNFGSAIRYINSDNFSKAHLENNFGSMVIYFDNAVIRGDEAYVRVDNNFGEIILYIPKEWKVQNELDRFLGSVSEYGIQVGNSSAILYISGDTNFGIVEIYYV